jgi:serine/threonine protein kinase
MLDVHGQAILMDFGIVKIIGGASHTATGAVVGTARYMSPEMIRSEVPDQRSDIYSLGITLYEMLSGEPPFNADSAMSLMMMHLNDPVPDLQSIRSDVPSALVNILKKSLEKEPDRRYSSATEMAAELKRVLAELERQQAASEATQPEAAVQASHQVETQVEAPAPEIVLAQSDPDQQADYVATKQDTGVPAKAMVETVGDQPAQAPAYESPAPHTHDGPATKSSRLPLLLGLGAGGIILIIIVIAGIFFIGNLLSPAASVPVSDTPDEAQQATSTQPVLAVATEPPTLTPTSTSVPTETPTPTNTLPPLYARINSITVNSSNQYVVEYETFGYTETLPGMHVHFFFDTVPPEQAGVPGSGPWILYGGPRPFTKYGVGDRPGSATQMCALVANADHSVIQASGNCYDLP